MASTDTSASISSAALALLGARAIKDLEQDLSEAAICKRLYQNVKNSTLSLYPWSFSIAKATLAPLNAAPPGEWKYQYQLPVKALNPLPLAVRKGPDVYEKVRYDWEMGASVDGRPRFYSNSDTVHVDYQRDIPEGSLPEYFVQLLIYQMAWNIAIAVTGQKSLATYWKEVAIGSSSELGRGGYFRQAMNLDKASEPSQVLASYILTDVRQF